MGLSLTLDPPVPFLLQPDYRHHFSAAELAQRSLAQAPIDKRQFWVPPTLECVMLKPLQMQPDFLNHQAQLDIRPAPGDRKAVAEIARHASNARKRKRLKPTPGTRGSDSSE